MKLTVERADESREIPVIGAPVPGNPAFAIVNLAFTLINLVAFSVMLIGPYFLVPRLGLLKGGLVLASGFIAMAATSPLAGAVLPRLGAERAAPLGALLTATGLFSVGLWQPDTGPIAMMLSLGLHGLGMGFFQVAYMELVLAASPLAHRGVAGSLSMLTRTIGVVTAAAALTLGFQAIESAVMAQGVGETPAFLFAFRTMFRLVGIAAMLIAALFAWSAPRRR